MKRYWLHLVLVLAVGAAPCLADKTPAAVSDPDGKNPQNLDLPRISIQKPVTISVVGGEAWFEQAVVIWRANTAASMVQVGQVARGRNAKGREGEGGDCLCRPLTLSLSVPGDYYFACYHKVQTSHGEWVTGKPWVRSLERLEDGPNGGYTFRCSDNNGSTFGAVVISVPPTK
jgi:hypothetical protein